MKRSLALALAAFLGLASCPLPSLASRRTPIAALPAGAAATAPPSVPYQIAHFKRFRTTRLSRNNRMFCAVMRNGT